MSESTIKKVFEETVTKTVDNFCSTCSHQLSQWFKEHKEVDISPEEICVALNAPFRAQTPSMAGSNIQTQMPSLPNYYSGTGVSPSKKKGGRSKKVVDPNLPDCSYVMTRGKTPGKKCPNQVLGDSTVLGGMEYCKQCLIKTGVKKKLEGPATKSVVQPPVLPGNVVKIPEQSKNKKGDLEVLQIPGREGFYREVKYGFIVQKNIDDAIITSSIDDNGTERDLRPDEREIALSLGIQVPHKEAPLPSVPVETTEDSGVAVPAVPSVPQVPAILS